MEKFRKLTGVAAPMNMINIDTDQIIPKLHLRTIKRTGLGKVVFEELRFNTDGSEKPDFVLNQEPYRNAKIIVAGDNFGCGSSREHAPWALDDYGIRVIIAPSYADIFFNNSFKNGLLPIVLDRETVDRLFKECAATPGYRLTIDLAAQTVTTPTGTSFKFEVDAFRKHCLLNGLDDIGLTLQHVQQIKAYEQRRKQEAPWLFAE